MPWIIRLKSMDSSCLPSVGGVAAISRTARSVLRGLWQATQTCDVVGAVAAVQAQCLVAAQAVGQFHGGAPVRCLAVRFVDTEKVMHVGERYALHIRLGIAANIDGGVSLNACNAAASGWNKGSLTAIRDRDGRLDNVAAIADRRAGQRIKTDCAGVLQLVSAIGVVGGVPGQVYGQAAGTIGDRGPDRVALQIVGLVAISRVEYFVLHPWEFAGRRVRH